MSLEDFIPAHEEHIKGQELVLINPEFISKDNLVEVEEGCLSYVGIYAKIPRYKNVSIKNFKADGTSEIIEAEAIMAQAIQHEIDHFSGKCFVDYFTPAQKIIYENRIKRIK